MRWLEHILIKMTNKIGVSLKIDVSKIDKTRLFEGAKGTYLDATVFIDINNEDQYGNNGFIAQSVSKEEREQGAKGAILGNVKVFYKDNSESQQGGNFSDAPKQPDDGFDVPF